MWSRRDARPNIPAVFSDIGRPWALHSSAYLDGIADLPAGYTGTLAVVGASQSPIEVVLNLARRLPRATVVNVMSGFGYRLKDTSLFSEEVYFPEFVDYCFHASPEGKDRLRTQPRPTNYSSADRDVIDTLYSLMYEDELDGRTRVTMRTNRAIDGARVAGDKVTLTMTERITGQREQCVADRVILATGYRDLGVHERYELLPPLLSDLADIVRMDQDSGCRSASTTASTRRAKGGTCHPSTSTASARRPTAWVTPARSACSHCAPR